MGSALSYFFGDDAAAATENPSSGEDSVVKSFHSSARWQLQLRELEDSAKLAVIDFTASWCGPCKMMAPVFHGLADKYSDVLFFKIDVDELSDVAQDFGVQAMPTFVLLKRGKEVDRVVGAKKDELEKKIDKYRVLQAAT